ncbi:MAG: M28 family peptidase [Candidatus Thermoplasmatota archaeon]
MRIGALAAILVLLVAGCGTPKDDKVPAAMDGDAALALVSGLISDDAGAPRLRVPGTPGHAGAGDWLWGAMQVLGWVPHWQNFTGADYVALDKGGVAMYEDPAYCSADEKARLASLAFSNLWAVRDEPTSDRLVLLGAHWESKRFANQDADAARRGDPVLGANDGASGVGLLLQLMRHIEENDVELPFDLGVVFFDGEDGFDDCHPLAGSLHFVSRLEPGEVDRFLLLDMVGDVEARFIVESASQKCDPALADLLQTKGTEGPLAANFPGTLKSVSDDHVPFIEAGIPAVDLIDFGRSGDRTQSLFGFPPYWHTTGDTLDKLDAGMLGHVGDVILAALMDPAFVNEWPDGCQD